MTETGRLSTGIIDLDDLLGGGLLPGTLTVVAGATGIGKTQLGLHFANQGVHAERERGIIFDMTSRGDSQNQDEYARRLFDWNLMQQTGTEAVDPGEVWRRDVARRDYLHIFERTGRRVTRNDLEYDDWKAWKLELVKKLQLAVWFFYGNFVHGVRRCVIDGVEPTDKPSESFQFDLFEYIYHQILHKDYDWVARDLFRERFRAQSEQVLAHPYDHSQIGCLLLYTTREVMLDDLLSRPLDSGDVLSNANTIILMGKTREGSKMGRALHVAKHRGSPCEDSIVPFEVTGKGLSLTR
ncbi:MAG TPA: ATPase domain-containing protein [Planctomycetaceae bacterium]|jgi:KaiC/GvpD/RAD55 family RecA-like ATPase